MARNSRSNEDGRHERIAGYDRTKDPAFDAITKHFNEIAAGHTPAADVDNTWQDAQQAFEHHATGGKQGVPTHRRPRFERARAWYGTVRERAYQHDTAIGVGIIALVAGTLVGGYVLRDSHEMSDAQKKAAATITAYTDPAILRETGTCADELRATAANLAGAGHTGGMAVLLSVIDRGAAVAEANDIPCVTTSGREDVPYVAVRVGRATVSISRTDLVVYPYDLQDACYSASAFDALQAQHAAYAEANDRHNAAATQQLLDDAAHC